MYINIPALVLFFNLKNKNDDKEENETKPHKLSLREAERLSYLFIRLAETAMTKGCWDTCSPTFKSNANSWGPLVKLRTNHIH